MMTDYVGWVCSPYAGVASVETRPLVYSTSVVWLERSSFQSSADPESASWNKKKKKKKVVLFDMSPPHLS